MLLGSRMLEFPHLEQTETFPENTASYIKLKLSALKRHATWQSGMARLN
jgi:hypothetical protein